MNRRNFLVASSLSTAGTICAPSPACATVAPSRIRWTRNEKNGVVSAVACDGQPLALLNPATGALGATLRIGRGDAAAPRIRLGADLAAARLGPLRVELKHRLLDSGATEDVLAAEMVILNESDQEQHVEAMFLTSLQPDADLAHQQIHIPLSAAGGSRDPRFAELGVANFLEDCEQQVGEADFASHYLEPMAGFPAERTTRALLLAPVVDILHPSRPWRVALFMPSDQPARFRSTGDYAGGRVWEIGRSLTVPPGGTATLRGWLHLHTGDASEAWRAFHRFGHQEDHPAVEWTRNFRVHYYDFLSSADGKNGLRGNGYEADLKHFREFHVGLATQHGYYPCMGDHLHPDRKEWLAMKGSSQGPAKMSIAKIKERIKATRAAGAKAGIYMHLTAFDDSSMFNPKLTGGRRLAVNGKPERFGWNGPDVAGGLWWMSMSSDEWRAHLLQQAEWIMEIFSPDAIVVDETFTGLGYDHNPGHPGPTSTGSIDFCRKLRSLVRSYGADRAVFSSDCSLAPSVYWFDGECGDHAYKSLLGRPSYAKEPVRFLAALGDKPWRPCSWHFQGMWEAQMKLARQVGAGVGVSNGWIEFTGLAGLPAAAKARMLADINTLVR